GKIHAKETLSILAKGYQSGLENGNLEYGGYAAMQKCQYSYFIGQELTELAREMAIASCSLAQLKQNNALIWNQAFQQTVINLLQTSNNPCDLTGEAYNEQEYLPLLKQANDRTGLHYFYVNKLILYYLFGDHQQALENAIAAANYLDGVTAFLVVQVFHFYDSLVRLALYPSVPNVEQDSLLNQVQANQEKMRKWADRAPMNFQHKFDLVEAEKCRILGERLEAIDLYDRAIQGAKENDYINDVAIAYELAAKFYLSQGKELTARAYIQEARYFYQLWGATAKVKDLEKNYPQLLTLTSTASRIKGTTTTHTSSRIDSGATLDLATVMKASQAISGEIVLEKLLVSLMKIIIQNAGAQLGYLILETKGQLLIEASGVINDDNITALQSIPLESHLPVTLVNYVARLQEDVVLNDASRQGNFVNDPYIISHQPKSILCTTLLNQGQLIGIVYLENNLTTGAFTADRLEVIKLLSGQAAISLENARLYQTLEDKVKERTAQLAAANQKINTLNKKLQAENLRLSAELDVAKKLQEMVLPKTAELEAVTGLEIAGYMEPADEMGGDYYDVLSSEDGVKIAIGDVTGHGLESGVLMLMVQTAVRTLQKVNETDPVRFLDILNQTLYDNLQRMNSDKNMTLAILDYAEGMVKLSGQHEEMIVVRSEGIVEKIDTIDLGFPIGLVSEIADFIDQTTVKLNSEDVVILYSDGITEAENINKQLYGLEKLCQIVRENRALSAQEIRQAVIEDLRQFIGNQKVFDDITLVILKQK
ncbi:MAG: SpoIIE family protein phosphatase, partial [Phormidium sp.]